MEEAEPDWLRQARGASLPTQTLPMSMPHLIPQRERSEKKAAEAKRLEDETKLKREEESRLKEEQEMTARRVAKEQECSKG